MPSHQVNSFQHSQQTSRRSQAHDKNKNYISSLQSVFTVKMVKPVNCIPFQETTFSLQRPGDIVWSPSVTFLARRPPSVDKGTALLVPFFTLHSIFQRKFRVNPKQSIEAVFRVTRVVPVIAVFTEGFGCTGL